MSNAKKDALLAFIECYRSLPELWNTECVSYSNRAKKAAAYDILIEKLKPLEPDATRVTVVKKINNLRSAFRKELKKVKDSKRSGASSDEIYVPSLWYFSELMFLVDQETPDESEDWIYPPSPSISLESPTPGVNPIPQPNKKRKSTPSAQDLITKATRYFEDEDDDYLIMAMGYAVKLRKLTHQQLMFADKLINEALLDAQLGVLTRNSYLVHPSATCSKTSEPLATKN